MPSASSPRRRPGAPIGNTNALKHGFYAKKLALTDLADLEGHSFLGLSEEIQALRVFIRRLIKVFNGCTDPERVLSCVRVISLALISLTRLLRTEKLLDNTNDSAFKTALTEMCEELGIKAADPD